MNPVLPSQLVKDPSTPNDEQQGTDLQEKLSLKRHDSKGTDRTHTDAPPAKEEIDFPDGGLRAWLVLLGALSMTTTTFGVVNSWGIFQTYYSQNILSNWSPSALSWIGSVQYALTFFPAIFTGRMFDLGYFRIPMFCFSTFLFVATMLMAECTQYWQFFLCQGLAIGLTSGLLFGPALGCVSHWFKRRRATAYGLVACGSSVGGTVFPILVRNLIPIVGFRWTMRIFAFVVLTLLGIANLTLRRRLPVVNVSGGLFNIRVLKNPPFAAYVTAGFFCFLGQYTVLTYIDSSAVFYGVNENIAFYLVAIANAASMLGRISAGIISDRIGPLSNMIPMTAVAAALTYAWPYARTSGSMVVVAVFYGISSSAFVGLLAVPVVNMGSTDDVGRRQGITFSLLSVGAVLGPPISGLIHDATNDYTAVGFYAGSMILVSVGFLILSRRLLVGRFIGGKA